MQIIFNYSDVCVLCNIDHGALWKKIDVLDKLHLDMSYSTVSHDSMLITQQYLLNKVSFNRNIKIEFIG